MNIILRKIKLVGLGIILFLTGFNFNNTFAFVTINNLPEYNQVDTYWGNGTADYLYQFIRRWLAGQVSNYSNIHSFKDLSKIQQIHKKIEISLKGNLPIKIKILFEYLDDLLYNYSDDLYGSIIEIDNNSNSVNNINQNNYNHNELQNNYNSNINLNHGKDNINQQLLKQYMCKDYNKTFIDFGCGTSSNSFNKEFIKNTVEHQKAMLKNTIHWDKYKLKDLYSYFDRIHFLNVLDNWLYKTIYLSSPAGFVKLFYYNVQYVNGAIPESYDTIFVNGQTNKIADGIQNSLEEIGKFIAENPQYNIDKTSLFKNLINFLETNYLNR